MITTNHLFDGPDHYTEQLINMYNMYDIDYYDHYPPTPKKYRDLEVLPVRNNSIDPKIGRNSQCPCGSGIKYKKCCGK